MTVEKSVGEVSAAKQTYRWVIDNFCVGCKNVGDVLESPDFSTNVSIEYKWQLWLYPKGHKEEYKDYVSVFLCNRTDKDVTANISISILNRKNEVFKSSTFTENTLQKVTAKGFPGFIRRDIVTDRGNDILTDDKLIIECVIILDAGKNSVIEVNEKEEEKNADSRRLQEFDELEHLINEKDFSDVSLVVEGKTFEAHKCILARRSPVFAAMFKAEMKEKQENKVEIEDIKHNIIMEMLRYMYTGKVNDIQTISGDLLAAADKYSLDGLKILCGKSLLENLNTDSAVESLKIADRYRMNDLKAKIIEFIVAHSNDIVNEPAFGSLTADVLCEVCRAINNKK